MSGTFLLTCNEFKSEGRLVRMMLLLNMAAEKYRLSSRHEDLFCETSLVQNLVGKHMTSTWLTISVVQNALRIITNKWETKRKITQRRPVSWPYLRSSLESIWYQNLSSNGTKCIRLLGAFPFATIIVSRYHNNCPDIYCVRMLNAAFIVAANEP